MVKFPNPFIVKPLYAFQDLENLYFVVEYVQGGDLA
jgi:serine/threonine protein kinase